MDRRAIALVVAGCFVALAVFATLPDKDTPATTDPSAKSTAVSGTLGTTRADTGDFSIRQAFVQLYGNYDPNLDGAFWKPSSAPAQFARWNGRALFIRPLISKSFSQDATLRHIVVTNSLDVRDGEVVKQGTGCRTCGSIVGAAIFQKTAEGGWTLISRHDFLTADGAWGGPPQVSMAFPPSGGIELRFESTAASPREPGRRSYVIVLTERARRAP